MSSTMETTELETLCKFTLCVLLTQFGKTFTTIGRINEEILRDPEYGRSIHLVWTMNTLLNNAQFANRLKSLEQVYGEGSVVIFASKYTGTYKHVRNLNELKGLVLDNYTCPRVIVMCSNDIRFTDGFAFVNILNSNTTNIQRVFAYYDELHRYITDKLREQIEQIDTMEIVKGIMAMTATPRDILQESGYWSRVRMIMLDDFNEGDYVGVGNMDFHLVDDYFPSDYRRPAPFDFEKNDEQVLGFMNHVLDRHPDILNRGAFAFIPGHIRRLSHQAIRAEVFKRCASAVVIVLNGEEKTLKFYNGSEPTVIPLTSQHEEVCTTISRIIQEKALGDRPIVVTGYLCVGMGQTLLEKQLGPFTAAIFSHMGLTNDEIYQLFGRCTARSRNWPTYRCTNIYCPTKIMHRVIAMEECARNLAKEHNGEIITAAMYDAPLHIYGFQAALENMRPKKEKQKKVAKPPAVEHPVGFRTREEVDSFLTNIYKKPLHPTSFLCSPQTDGYTLSTRLTAYYHKTKKDLTAGDRLTKEFFKNIKHGFGISRKEGSGQPYMVYPVYENLQKGRDDFVYYVRYMPPA